jgi:hypothetical protein
VARVLWVWFSVRVIGSITALRNDVTVVLEHVEVIVADDAV